MWANESLIKAFKEKGLTARESEVAYWVSKGGTNQAIAKQLFVAEKTIKFHLTRVFYKLGIKSRSQLIVWSMPHQSFINPAVMAEAVARNIAAPEPKNDEPKIKLPYSRIGNA